MDPLSSEDARQLLETQEVAHIAVLSEGEPYVSPVSYVMAGDELIFRTGPGKRLAAIGEHPRVCIEVTSYDAASGEWTSAIAWGDAYVVEDGLRSADTVALLLDKYRHVMGSPLTFGAGVPMSEPVIVAVRLTEISGRSSGSFLGPRSRPGRL